ncbi:MAG: tetratricopeptide repeat protein, partial [Bacteroidota bacterium]
MKFASKLFFLALLLTAHVCAAQSDGQDQVKSVEKVFELIRSDRAKAKAQLDSFRSVTDLSPMARMTLLRFYGIYYAINGQLDSAEYYFRYVGDHAIPNSILRGKALFNLSVIHKNRGQFEQALEFLGQALKIYEEVGDKRLVAEVYGEMASVNKTQGYLDISLDYLLRAIQILESNPGSSQYAITIERQKLANTYLMTGDYEFAVKMFEQVLPSFLEQKDMVNYGLTEASYSLALTKTGRFEEADKAADRALKAISDYDNNDHLALAHLQKAVALSKLGNNTGAIQYFEKALAYSAKGYGSFDDNLYLSYMEVLMSAGKTEEAYRIYRDAVERKIFDNANTRDLYSFYTVSARLLEQKGLLKESVEKWEKAQSMSDSLAKFNEARIARELQHKYKSSVLEKEVEVSKLTEKNLKREVEVRTLYLLVALLSCISLVGLVLYYRLKNRYKIQEIEKLEETNSSRSAENAVLQDNLRLKQLIIEQQQHELAGNALEMANLNEKIEQILERTSSSGKMSDVTRMLNDMKSSDKNWESLLLRFKKLNPDFMDKLQARFPELSQSELEFCALVKLNLSFKD